MAELSSPTTTPPLASSSGHTKTVNNLLDEFLDDFLMGNDDDVFDAIILQGASNIVPASTLLLAESTNMEETKADHTGRRKSRRRFDHAAIRDKLYSHFLGPGPYSM